MWVPYTIICDEKDVKRIKKEAKKNWFVSERIWTVIKRENENIAWIIKWVWVNNSEIEIEEKIEK
jgi:hypothetical protein